MAQQHFTGMRGRHRPFALDQHRGQGFFQRFDALGNSAPRNAEHAGRAVKALLLDHSGKRFQLITIQHMGLLRQCQQRQIADCIHLEGCGEILSRWRGYRARLNGFQSFPSVGASWNEWMALGVSITETHGVAFPICGWSFRKSPQGATPEISPLADLRTIALLAHSPRPFAA